MAEKIQAIRGMNDVLPQDSATWRQLENVFADCLSRYGYHEIRFPVVESTHLFKRTIGEVTDIVEKEMYTFTDLNGDSLTLRPEGTAGCLRACLEHGLLHNQQQKLWYLGPMFRHEKPQKGRYRQFHQLGVEALGMDGVEIELELISMCRRLWRQLGIETYLRLQINTIGELSERQAFRERLVAFLTPIASQLDADSQRRLTRNPLRILDSKNPEVQALLRDAPTLSDSLSEASRQKFHALCQGLDRLGIAYDINPLLVRGLDYYGHTVFEWVTDQLGSQATVCAGGRYDVLVEQLGGQSTPAIGFAMGLERLLLLMETLDVPLDKPRSPLFFLVAVSDEARQQALVIAEELRDANPAWRVINNTAGGSFKSQFKKADKSGADFALILGDDELQQGKVSVKNLRRDEEQVTIYRQQLSASLKGYLGE
ncbi:histidine--tRNA ligase [Legionella sp. CNM-4043-24]|uniref:histidine--tRNA ligase n=1 Tax=Legionella sp. CNM-4043-24 TaxID=3421646 RepID=UPI00403AECEF